MHSNEPVETADVALPAVARIAEAHMRSAAMIAGAAATDAAATDAAAPATMGTDIAGSDVAAAPGAVTGSVASTPTGAGTTAADAAAKATEAVAAAAPAEDRTYRLTERCLARLMDEMAKLAKRTAKLSLPPETAPAVEVLASEYVPVARRNNAQRPAVMLLVHTVRVRGEAPRLAGWSLIARLQHFEHSVDDVQRRVNIIRAVPKAAAALPPAYRTAPPRCDHCQSDRRRNDTYVLVNERGEHMQVGRNCLRDFLGGTSPQAMVGLFELITEGDLLAGELAAESQRELDEDVYDRSGGGGPQHFDLAAYLSYVAQAIREHGWLGARRARDEMRTSTADRALSAMLPPPGERDQVPLPSEEERAAAQEAIAWGRELGSRADALSDYEHNLHMLSEMRCIPLSLANIAASLVYAWQRATQQAVERQRVAQISRHVGEPGERRVFEVRITGLTGTESRFGLTTVVRLVDRDGNRLVWFASGSPDLREDGWYRLRGTVKEHGEFRGVAQTVLTRCVVVAELDEAAVSAEVMPVEAVPAATAPVPTAPAEAVSLAAVSMEEL